MLTAITLDGDNMTSTPTRNDLRLKLEGLCSGEMTREDVATWAVSIIEDDSVRVTDSAVWDILKRLGAVDLPTQDRDFLYMDIDFDDWAARLREA